MPSDKQAHGQTQFSWCISHKFPTRDPIGTASELPTLWGQSSQYRFRCKWHYKKLTLNSMMKWTKSCQPTFDDYDVGHFWTDGEYLVDTFEAMEKPGQHFWTDGKTPGRHFWTDGKTPGRHFWWVLRPWARRGRLSLWQQGGRHLAPVTNFPSSSKSSCER